jgi:hypothetical protein
MSTSCRCCGGVASISHASGGTNSGCHGNTGGVTAHQKHIITAPRIVLVPWDDFFVNTAGAPDVATQFMTDLVSGLFMNGLVQYGVDRGSVAATFPISSTKDKPDKTTWDVGGSDDGDQLVSWLNDGTVATKPAVNETHLFYVILLPTTLGLTNGTNSDGTPNTNVCGWHHHRKYNGSSGADDLFWCVIRTDLADTSSTHNFINSIAFCAGHETAEALTNRDDQGWHGDDSNGCEIGDLCEQLGTTFPYQATPTAATWDLEKYWSDWDNTCILGNQPVSVSAFLKAIGFPSTQPLNQLGTPVISLSYMASKLA